MLHEMTEKDSSNLRKYLDDLKDDADLMQEQTFEANRDLRFINVDGGQWEDDFNNSLGNRTLMELDLISPYVARFIGEWNLNRVGVDFLPDDDSTSDDDADLMNGIYRADYRDYSGKLSVDNAVDEAAKCGYGAFKLATVFEDSEDPNNDNQRVEWRPIYNPHQVVYWDGNSKRIDKADAAHCTILTPFTKKVFEAKYPEISPASAYTPYNLEYRNLNASSANEIYVATRYEVVKRKETVFIYHNLETEQVEVYSQEDHKDIKDELAKNELMVFARERKVIRQRVMKSVFTRDDFIETPRRIAGKYIPIIPIYGFWGYVDGAEWYRGLVRKLIDAQRVFNMVVSQLAENSASSGQKTPIVDPEQIKGYEDFWADRNNNAYLPLKALRDRDGNAIQSGPLGYLEPSQLDGNTEALFRIVLEVIKEITGGNPQEILDPQISGKALNAILKRVSMNTQEIQDNIANAIEWSGKVYQAIASEIYNRPRMVRTIGVDGTHGRKRINDTIIDEQTGKVVESNRLNGKKFRVYSDIGPQYETQREEKVEFLKGVADIIKGSTLEGQYMAPVFAEMVLNSPGETDSPIKKVARRQMLAMGLVQPESDEEKQYLAQIQQAQMQGDKSDEFLKAASAEALGKAEEAVARARKLDTDSLKNIAEVDKTTAETQKIISETDDNRAKTIFDMRQQILERAQDLPIN